MNDKPVSFKGLVQRSYVSKLYFSFNINNFILNENKQYYNSLFIQGGNGSGINQFMKNNHMMMASLPGSMSPSMNPANGGLIQEESKVA